MPPPRNSTSKQKTSPLRIKQKRRAVKALNLRAEGRTFPEIAAELGYNSKQAAHDAVLRELKAIVREPAETVLTLDLERLDSMWQVPYLSAQGGDIAAIGVCLKIMERRAKLLGLEVIKNEHSGPNGGPLTNKITVEFVDADSASK